MTKKDTLHFAFDGRDRDILLPAHKGTRTLLMGVAGSGKTILLNTLLCAIAECGKHQQGLIITPKRVGFAPFKKRFTVVTDKDFFTSAIECFYNEMMARYELKEELEDLADQEADHQHEPSKYPDISLEDKKRLDKYFSRPSGDLKITKDLPLLWLVIDEISSFMAPADKKEARAREDFYTLLSEQSREANMSLIMAGQTLNSDTIPTRIRNNFDNRLILRTANETQTALCVADGYECDAHLIDPNNVGEGRFFTPYTSNEYAKGRVYDLSTADARKILRDLQADKQDFKWLDLPKDEPIITEIP